MSKRNEIYLCFGYKPHIRNLNVNEMKFFLIQLNRKKSNTSNLPTNLEMHFLKESAKYNPMKAFKRYQVGKDITNEGYMFRTSYIIKQFLIVELDMWFHTKIAI
jgi:hypothetical protein